MDRVDNNIFGKILSRLQVLPDDDERLLAIDSMNSSVERSADGEARNEASSHSAAEVVTQRLSIPKENKMRQLFEYGNTIILEHGGMTFLIFKSIIHKPTVDVIGCYKDKADLVKRIRRESVYGKSIIALYPPEV